MPCSGRSRLRRTAARSSAGLELVEVHPGRDDDDLRRVDRVVPEQIVADDPAVDVEPGHARVPKRTPLEEPADGVQRADDGRRQVLQPAHEPLLVAERGPCSSIAVPDAGQVEDVLGEGAHPAPVDHVERRALPRHRPRRVPRERQRVRRGAVPAAAGFTAGRRGRRAPAARLRSVTGPAEKTCTSWPARSR